MQSETPETVRTNHFPMVAGDRIFCGYFPTGYVWADRKREVAGDYKKLAYMSYRGLRLELQPDCPAELAEIIRKDAAGIQARRGEREQIAGNMSVTLGGR